MKCLSYRNILCALLLHLFLIATVATSQEKDREKKMHGVVEKDPKTGVYRVKPESQRVQAKSSAKSKFDRERFEKELNLQKRFTARQEEMKKLHAAEQKAKNEKGQNQKRIVQQPKFKKVKFFGKETEFYEGPRFAKRSHSSLAKTTTAANVMINGKQADTIFTGDPFTLSFSFSPDVISAVVRISLDMNNNGIIDAADIPIVSNGFVIDNGDIDLDPAAGKYRMDFLKGNFYSTFVAMLIVEVDDFQSLSSATLAIKEKMSSKVIIGIIKPAFKNTIVYLASATSSDNWRRYYFPDSTGTFTAYADTTMSKSVGVRVFTADKTPDGYIPPHDTLLTIKKDTTRFSSSYIAATEFIEGYVKDQNGGPIKGSIVEANSNTIYLITNTDDLGYYKLGVVKGISYLHCTPPAPSSEYMSYQYQYHSVEVGANQTLRQDFIFLKANSTISGSVKYGSAGIGGVPVYAYNDSLYTFDLTKADGNYTLQVYKPSSGSLSYSVSANVGEYGYFIDSSYRPNISPGAVNVNFTMKKTTGGMQGRITDINTGVPVMNADLNFFNNNSSRYIQSNDSGYYKVSLPDGIYSLSVNAPYYDYYQEYNITVSGSVISKNISLTRTGSFSGSVTDESGHPIASANVYSRDSSGYYYNYGYTDNQGKYVVSGLMTSSYKAQASVQGFISQWYDKKSVMESATSFAVTKGFDTPNINFVLSRGASISGAVKDKIGNGISGAYVFVLDTSFLNFISTGETDDSGHYVVSGLSTGKYFVVAASDSFLPQWYDGVTNYTNATMVSVIVNQNTHNINFTLIKGGTIAGIVKDKAGNPIPGSQIVAYDTNYYSLQYGFTNESGMYEIKRLPPGNKLYVTASAYGFSQRWYDNVESFELATPLTVQDDQRKEGINFILPMGGKISGTVKNKAGAPVQYASVYASQANGYNYYYGNTDELGNYIIAGINSGKYFVSAYQYDYTTQWYNHKSSMELADTVAVVEEKVITGVDFDLQEPVPVIIRIPADYTTIQQGIDAAKDGDTILVSSGTYNENIFFNYKAIVVLSKSGPVGTIIDGTGIGSVVTGAPGSTIEGFTITGGEDAWYMFGIEAGSSTMTIRGNIIKRNWGGINTSNYEEPLIQKNLIFNNKHFGIVASFYSKPTIVNNTIVHNGEDGIASQSGAGLVMNNIIASNGAYGISCTLAESSPVIKYNDVYKNGSGNYTGCKAGKGDISAAPMFADSTAKNFKLVSGSPCIDSGDPASPLDSDSTRADMGALYFHHSPTGVNNEGSEQLPTEYSLQQNYPNPFNPSTAIRFNLPSQSFVSLKVYNALGQEVATLVNEVRPAGRYTERWTGTTLASGVYFYTLRSKSFVQTKKMIMLK